MDAIQKLDLWDKKIQDNPAYKVWLKHKKFFHFVQGIAVILLLISLNVFLYQDFQLKDEISENCGWGEEDYECYCQKGEAIALKNLMESELNETLNITLEIEDVSLDR